MRKESEFIESLELREKMINRLEVLDKVGDLLLLPNTEFATTEQVARYFKVGIEAIQSLIKDNRDELTSNGFGIRKRKEILNVLEGQLEIKIPNRGMNLFPKRAILNVAMLLRDSEVAKEIRVKLLDIVQDVSEGKDNIIENIIEEIDREKSLQMELGIAICSGDMPRVIEITTEINKIRNEREEKYKIRIDDLETEIDILKTNSLTIIESRSVINRLVRIIAMKEFNGIFGRAWGELYSKVNYKLNTNIKARNRKSGQSILDVVTDEELQSMELIVKAWANELGVDIKKELKLAS